ncbi:LacI family DNA-binding transcriptional regulator [Roseobacteraceae bacterium S113]
MTQMRAGLGRTTTSRRVTITDLAQALGMTKSTVSRAMNGYTDIAESTRLRVHRMAEKMDYRPLSNAQAIKTGRARALGLVLQLSDHDAHRPFLAEFLAGVSEGASAQGHTLTVASADTDADLIDRFRELRRDGKADGFILPRAMVNDPRVAFMQHEGIPFVLFGRQEQDKACWWFDIRGEDAMRDAVMHLAQLGHERIGFINGGTIYTYAALRQRGFEQGMHDAGLLVDPELCASNAVTLEDGAQHARALLDMEHPPTAIVCAVDFAALGVYRAAAERGLVIGRDLSVVAYDGIKEGAHAEPPLTTFSVDNRAAGRRLSELLIMRLRGKEETPCRETQPARFLDRGSTGPCPAK